MVIDISHHNGIVDFDKIAKNKDIEGVIVRIGYGDNIKSQDDRYFTRNIEECIIRGIPVGTYIYSYAVDMDQAKSEVEHCLRLLKPYKNKLNIPCFLDIEERKAYNSNIKDRVNYFLKTMNENGYKAGVYCDEFTYNHYLNFLNNDSHSKWIAKYSNKKPNTGIKVAFDMWQYSSKIKIDGIIGNVDASVLYRKGMIRNTVKATKKKTQKEIANEIIKGLWGDGTERVTKLKNAGYTDSQIKSIQKQVNNLLK
jgi:lysozyme